MLCDLVVDKIPFMKVQLWDTTTVWYSRDSNPAGYSQLTGLFSKRMMKCYKQVGSPPTRPRPRASETTLQ